MCVSQEIVIAIATAIFAFATTICVITIVLWIICSSNMWNISAVL